MATYTVTNSFSADTTAVASEVNQNFTDVLTALNSFDAANLTGTIALARISNLTSTQMSSAFFKDEDDMASNSATAVSSQQALKAYVDAQIASATAAFTALTNLDDDGNAIAVDHAYLANQDGDVFVVITTAAAAQNAICYKDSDSNPASGGTIMARYKKSANVSSGDIYSLHFNVKSGEYFEITSAGTTSRAIYWRGRGSTLIEVTDQD